MNGFLYFAFGISPKLKVGQIWIPDEKMDSFDEFYFIEIVSLTKKFVEYRLSNGRKVISPIKNFKYLHTLYR